VQVDYDRAVLRIVPGASYRPGPDAERIRASFRETFLGSLEVDVETVASIEKTPAGKHLPIIKRFQTPAVLPPEAGNVWQVGSVGSNSSPPTAV
jgi:hypothetical protein